MLYKSVKRGLNSKAFLLPKDAPIDTDLTGDWYTSLYFYSQKHKDQFDRTSSLAGITDPTTNRLWLDFDSKEDLEAARRDALIAVSRLQRDYSITESQLSCYFTGGKGFSVEMEIDRLITTSEFASCVLAIAGDLPTFDKQVFDAQRVVRIPYTKHQRTGLFKTRLSTKELHELPIDTIKEYAEALPENTDTSVETSNLPNSLFATVAKVKPVVVGNTDLLKGIDFTRKVKGWSNCKFAISEGYEMRPGNRHNKMMMLLAHSKATNLPKEKAYYNVKDAYEKGIAAYGGEALTKTDKDEIWTKAGEVYSDDWRGGSYSCKDGKSIWLTELCESLGHNKCKHGEEKEVFTETDEMSSIFARFSTEIEKNTIKSGIPELDENVMMMTSTVVGLVGNPGSGKTTLALKILNYCSRTGVDASMFSMDMGIPMIYLVLASKHFQLSKEEVFEIFKNDPIKKVEIETTIAEEYKNVSFSFKSGLDVEEIRQAIFDRQEQTGKKTRLVVIDYLECIQSDNGTDTVANTARIANQLKDIANETETCILLLLQTQKANAVDEPILSMKSIKGSAVVEQSLSVALGVWREGYNPKYIQDDNFISLASLKDRFGPLWREDFSWNGKRREIGTLTDEARAELAAFRARKAMTKAKDEGHGF